ncbi:hypothetical protein A6A10_07330 [Otariodibacter oris]|uniref:protein-N(pi)-phosphohistidine--D-fructose phosphotransferase n=1 Tax=Otariodibacter oris TaxID=1032623 RepID=A0A420XGW5_9PAST|nr:hypothetical protein A6A10_07330 [Otariodibacter oris]RKR72793.1 PTS system fructose-specific IIC component [Otariodibacter oris]
MKIALIFPSQLGQSRTFLVNEVLSAAATQQGHTIVEPEQAEFVLLFEQQIPDNVIGKKGAIVDIDQAFNQPEETLLQAVNSLHILANNNAQQDAKGTTISKDKIKKIVGVTACPTGVTLTFMSAEAISKYAKTQGWEAKIETAGQIGSSHLLSKADIEAADLVFVAADIDIDLSKFEGKLLYRTSTNLALKKTEQEFDKAIKEAKIYHHNDKPSQVKNKNMEDVKNPVRADHATMDKGQIKKIVGVTACPTGVTLTFMSAEAIANYAKEQGWEAKIETWGQVGSNNLLSKADIEEADLVFIAADIDIDLSKFKGKPLYRTTTNLALKKTEQEFDKALKEAQIY